MRITLTLAAVCACLFGLLMLSDGSHALGTLTALALVALLPVAVIEALLTVTGAIRFFTGPRR